MRPIGSRWDCGGSMARIQMPSLDAMTSEQAAACSKAVQGPRGKVPTPMIGWLANPKLARRLRKLGALLRCDTSLDPVETELTILVCARHWTSHVSGTRTKRWCSRQESFHAKATWPSAKSIRRLL